jgi:hypothetical protein
MAKWNKGDLVRVSKTSTYPWLRGHIVAILQDDDSDVPPLDVTAFGNRGWDHAPGVKGWWIDGDDLEVIGSTGVKSVKKRVTVSSKGKRGLSPQAGKILALLKTKGSVTALEAAGVIRARSLSRRICDLKEAGYTIVTTLSNDTTGQRYARYYLKGEPQAVAQAA